MLRAVGLLLKGLTMKSTEWLERLTRVLFFTGKGGVGKTSIACATALALADRGKKVLLVSTDPASNLDEVLGVKLISSPTPIPGSAGLFALNIDPEGAARAYRERVVGPYRGVLPESAVANMEEQLSGACTTEIAAFDEFSKLLGDPEATKEFHHVVFDTAPTGHTLRLLRLPMAWTGFISVNTTGTSCLGPLSGLQSQSELYQASVKALSDSALTMLVLVSRLETPALVEAERSRAELMDIGVKNQVLAVNGIFTSADPSDPIGREFAARTRQAESSIAPGLRALPRVDFPLLPFAPMGMDSLRAMFGGTLSPSVAAKKRATGPSSNGFQSLPAMIDELVAGGSGVIMTMGKGGVGKTTVAAAIAVELARRGLPVHLTTTDPAAHIEAAVGRATQGISISRIDPAKETAAYQAEVMALAGKSLDQKGRDLLEEDLRSPCTEEIAVFRAFARAVAKGKEAYVVIDTAPTGHTLLLLDATEAYHRDVLRTASDMPDEVKQLLPRLRDPKYTRILIVALPEATPVHEAAALQEDLLRAGITPFGWVINQSFMLSGTRDPLLRERGDREDAYIREVQTQYAKKTVVIAWKAETLVGAPGLHAHVG